MIIELDTSLANKLSDLTINQLVFVTIVLNDNQTYHQDVYSLLSRVSEQEIQELVDKSLVTVTKTEEHISYEPTETLISIIGKQKDYFDELYDIFPVYVLRPDGQKGFLRANVNKCRLQYKKIVGKSKATHEHIIKCLNFELTERLRSNKLGYMKTMWKWLTNHEWEAFEEQMLQYTSPTNTSSQKVKLDGFC